VNSATCSHEEGEIRFSPHLLLPRFLRMLAGPSLSLSPRRRRLPLPWPQPARAWERVKKEGLACSSRGQSLMFSPLYGAGKVGGGGGKRGVLTFDPNRSGGLRRRTGSLGTVSSPQVVSSSPTFDDICLTPSSTRPLHHFYGGAQLLPARTQRGGKADINHRRRASTPLVTAAVSNYSSEPLFMNASAQHHLCAWARLGSGGPDWV